jgi:alpha-beta hydrolase superfamily lysophospholipase
MNSTNPLTNPPASQPQFTWWRGGAIDALDTIDGRIAYRCWEEARHAPKTLMGIHGFGGNNDNYIALGEALKPGVAVYAIDLAGNGQSGTPGDVADAAVHLRNLDALAKHIRSRHPQAQHYVAGFSLGAAYAPLWAARNPSEYRGMILFAPPYSNRLSLPPRVQPIFNVLATLAPKYRVGMEVRAEDGVDPRYLFAMRSNGYIRQRTLRSLKISADVVAEGKRALSQVTIPTLIVHGDADSIADPAGARIAFYRLGATDKTLHWVPGAEHDLYDVLSGLKSSTVIDEQRALVIRPVRDWLEAH